MPEQLVFRFPMPLNLGNSRMHYMVKHKEKVKYWAMCDLLAKGEILPPPPKKPWDKATISSTMVLGAAMDDGNAMNRHKWVEDWLVTRGYVVDDSKKHLKWAGFPEQRVSRKNEPSITIILTEGK